MSCNRLYGGQKKNKQQSKQVSQRKRSGGQGETPDGDVKVDSSSSAVEGVVKATEEAVGAVAASTEAKPIETASTGAAPTDAAASTEGKTVDTTSTNDSTAAAASAAPASAAPAAVAPTENKTGVFGLGMFGLGGKRRTQRKQRKQRKTQKAGSQKTVIGRLYSKTCVHCVAMEPEWKQLQKMIKQHGGNILMKDVEARQMDQQLPQVNKQFLGGSDQRVEMQGGFPTLFKIKNKKVEYYGGERTADAMYNWALQ